MSDSPKWTMKRFLQKVMYEGLPYSLNGYFSADAGERVEVEDAEEHREFFAKWRAASQALSEMEDTFEQICEKYGVEYV